MPKWVLITTLLGDYEVLCWDVFQILFDTEVVRCELFGFEVIREGKEEQCLEALKLLQETLESRMPLIRQIFIWFESTELILQKIKNIPNLIYNELSKIYKTERKVANLLVKGSMNLILKIRKHVPLNKPLLKSLITFFININIYDEIIHPLLLKYAQEFYEGEAREKVGEGFEICEYLHNVEERIQSEEVLIKDFLHKISRKKMIRIVENVFINDQLKILMSNLGLVSLFDQTRYKEINYLYHILQRINKSSYLRKGWQNYIKTKGNLLINNQSISISKIIIFKEEMDKFLTNSFDSSQKMKQSMQYAFEDFLNQKPSQIAHDISKYLDKLLKKSSKMIDENQIQRNLKTGLVIFKFIKAKDAFEAFYTQRLIKRLILEKSISLDLENEIILRLKDECGEEYTKNMEEVEKEVSLSSDLTQEFFKYLKKKRVQIKIDFKIVVLSQKSWTLNQYSIPQFFGDVNSAFSYFLIFQMKLIKHHFQKFYKQKQGDILLKWQFDCSETIVEANFSDKKVKTIMKSLITLLAVILNLYNLRLNYTFQQLLSLTRMEKQILTNMLISLTIFTENILIIDPPFDQKKKRKVNMTDKFILNTKYTSKKLRVKIHTVEKVERQKLNKNTQDLIQRERGHMIDACLIKILKRERKMEHQKLLEEMFQDLQVPIEVEEIKKRIEDLIRKDFIKRDLTQTDLYHYIS